MALDVSLLERLQNDKTTRETRRVGDGGSNGGDGPSGKSALDIRVGVVEATLASIDKTLAVMAEQLTHLAPKDDVSALRTETAVLSTKLDAKASSVDVAAISGKLDRMATSVDMAVLSGKLDGMASATDLAELKGRVGRIPTVPVLTSILVFVSLLFAAAAWVVRHLPPTWANAVQ